MSLNYASHNSKTGHVLYRHVFCAEYVSKNHMAATMRISPIEMGQIHAKIRAKIVTKNAAIFSVSVRFLSRVFQFYYSVVLLVFCFSGNSPCLMWIPGHSFVFWGALRVEVRPDSRQLGLPIGLGNRGMTWNGVFPEFHQSVRFDRPPDVLLLHVGGNDLRIRPFRELVHDIKFDLLRLWVPFPTLVTILSEILDRCGERLSRQGSKSTWKLEVLCLGMGL